MIASPEHFLFTDNGILNHIRKGGLGTIASAFCLWDREGTIISEYVEIEQEKPNNYGELKAIKLGLEYCIKNKIRNIMVLSDSEFSVKAISGEYDISAESIKSILNQVKELLKQLDYDITWIPRELNVYSDYLTAEALQPFRKTKKKIFSKELCLSKQKQILQKLKTANLVTKVEKEPASPEPKPELDKLYSLVEKQNLEVNSDIQKYIDAEKVLEDFNSTREQRARAVLFLSNNKQTYDLYIKKALAKIKGNKKILEAENIQGFLKVNDAKEKPILKPFIPEKSIIGIYGEPGTLKSIFVNYVGSCIASGKKFLDQYPANQQAVLILSTENSERTDRKRLKSIFKAMRINPVRRQYKNLKLKILSRNKVNVLNDEFFFNDLCRIIEESQIKLLIVDTISPLLMDTNDNQASEIVRAFNERFFKLIDLYGISVLFTMHSQKTGKDFLGSVKYKASVDAFYELERENNTLTLLCQKHREGEISLRLEVDFETKNENLYKINFKFLEEFLGKQSSRGSKAKDNPGDNPAKINLAKETISDLLREKELKWKEIMEELILRGISNSTGKRAMNYLFETKFIGKKPGKTGGYYIL